MNIVRCPRCSDDVTVPLRASPKALVRCPLCLEEYQLSEALGGLPPTLLVIDGSDLADDSALAGTGMAEADAGGEYRLSGGAFGAALDSSAPRRSTVVPGRPVTKGAARPKKREKNAIVEMIKIVLGGVLGLSMGYLVLLWAFNRDVLDLGPRVAPYAPWIVPAKFHGSPTGDSTASAGNAAGVDTSGDSSPADSGNGGMQKKKKQSELLGGGIIDGNAKRSAANGSKSGVGGGKSESTPDVEVVPIRSPEPDLGSLLPEVNPKPANTPEPKPESPSKEKPLPTAETLAKAVLAASDGYAKVNESIGQPADVRKQLYSEMYSAAAEVGRIVSHLDSSKPDLTEQVATLKTLLSGLAMQPGKVSALKSLTDLNLPERKHDEGVLLAGAVQGFEPAGSMYVCKLQAGKLLAETIVVSTNNPEAFCQPGDELLLVGRVVEHPQKSLRGYEGTAERIVLLGYGVTVPKTEPAP